MNHLRTCIIVLIVLSTQAVLCAQEGNKSYFGEEYPFHAERAEYMRSMMLNEQGEHATQKEILAAHAELERIHSSATSRSVAGLPTGGSLSSNVPVAELGEHPEDAKWTLLGPGNIGGHIQTLATDSSGAVYAGSNMGGVWRTDDQGATWESLSDTMKSQSIGSLAIDPTNSNTLFAGTGCYNYQGVGIYKSRDRGKTWNLIEYTTTMGVTEVLALAIDSTGTVLMAGTNNGIFYSSNSGVTWENVLSDVRIQDIEFDPKNESHVVASTRGGGKVFYSVNGGTGWKESKKPAGSYSTISVAFAKANSAIVYALVSKNDWIAKPMLWKSDDYGQEFQEITETPMSTYNEFTSAIWAGDPTNEKRVVIGGIGLFQSVDGGSTFKNLWIPHADMHDIISAYDYDGASNNSIIIGNDGGVHVTKDISAGSVSWKKMFSKEFDVTQFYSGAYNPSTDGLIGGTQDNGTLLAEAKDRPDGWRKIYGGDGGMVAVDPTRDAYYGGMNGGLVFSYVKGKMTDMTIIFRGEMFSKPDYLPQLGKGEIPEKLKKYLQDNYSITVSDSASISTRKAGVAWLITDEKAYTGLKWTGGTFAVFDVYLPESFYGHGNWLFAVAIDPNDPNTLFAGGRTLWRCTNPRDKNPLWKAAGKPADSEINAIAVQPGNSDVIYLGNNNGQIWKTVNGTESNCTWTRIDNKGTTPITNGSKVFGLFIDPSDSSTVYVSYAGYSNGNLWRTTDGGKSWTDLSKKLPNIPVIRVTVHPKDPNRIYVGTSNGILVSEDGGEKWSLNSVGPINCPINSLFWKGTTLICATFGRGMYQIDLSK